MDIESETLSILKYAGVNVNIDLALSPIVLRDILVRFPVLFRECPLLETDGAYIKKGDKHYIWLNTCRPMYRRRFSLGHEFGHYYLGHPSDVTVEIRSLQDHKKETEANRFSAALLMPRETIYKVHCARSTIKEIAHWFRVSEVAAAIRLKELGLRLEEVSIIMSDYYMSIGDPVYEF